MHLGAALRVQNPEKRHVHVEVSEFKSSFTGAEFRRRYVHVEAGECVSGSTDIEFGNRFVHVEVNECEMDFTGIKCVRESE